MFTGGIYFRMRTRTRQTDIRLTGQAGGWFHVKMSISSYSSIPADPFMVIMMMMMVPGMSHED